VSQVFAGGHIHFSLCVTLREELNSRTTRRFNALMMPWRANIVGPACRTTNKRT